MKKYFVLEDKDDDYRVSGILVFDTDATKTEIQNYIWTMTNEWYELEEKHHNGELSNDSDFYDFACQGEYVIGKTLEKFNGDDVGDTLFTENHVLYF